MRSILIASFFLVILIACQQKKNPEAFKKIDDRFSYRLVSLGDEKAIQHGDIVFSEIVIKNERGDTLQYAPDYVYSFKSGNHVIDSIIRLFKVGDELVLKVPRKSFLTFMNFTKVKEDSSKNLSLHIKLRNALPEQKAETERRRVLSERETNEELELSQFIKKDSSLNFKQGYYYKVIQAGSGDSIYNGSEVSLQYTGSFLNGYVFDNTLEKGITPTFQFGQSYQLVEGLRLALNGRRRGERMKIILPSRLAFGEKGSIAGIVPPYTAVIYDVNIVKVNN